MQFFIAAIQQYQNVLKRGVTRKNVVTEAGAIQT